MNKTYKCSLLALSVLASFTSCLESESLQQANLSNDKITFQPSLDNSWKPLSPSSSSRAAKDVANEEGAIVVPTSYGKPLYLLPLEQDGIYIWSKDGKRITRSGALLEDGEQEGAAQTRGTTKNDILDYGSFGVTAIYKEGNQNASLFQKDGDPRIAVATPFIHNKFWEIEDALWPKEGEVSFHAFAPYNANIDSPLGFTQDIANGKTQITYTASTLDVANQPDLIVATNKGQKSKEALGLNFYHALTAVTFAVDKNLAQVIGSGKQLTKVELRGIPNKGTCALSLSRTANVPNAVWTLENDKVTYSFDLTKENIIVGKEDYALTLGDQTLMMIPQTLPDGAEVCFTLKHNGETKDYTISLKDKQWTAGKSVIYKLSSQQISSFGLGVIKYDNSWNEYDKKGGSYYTNFPKSAFTHYDEVGLYIVNNSNELIAENLLIIRQDVNWRIYEANVKFPYSPGNCKYFFYYPYRKDKQNVDLTANTAEEFFKNTIDNLDITVDQSNWYNGSRMADLQVGKLELLPNGSLNVTMKHQVGLAVLHMPSSQNGTADFKNQSYRFYYGDKNYPNRPVAGQDFTGGYAIRGNYDQYFPSQKFEGYKPYINSKVIVDDWNGYYRCPFVVPFGKTVKFQADADPAETLIENDWGYVQDISATPDRNNPIVVKNIELDMPFKNIQVQYDGNTARVQEFDIPEVTEYTLYTWGARGNSINSGNTAAPGYATGKWTATANNKKLYICCGNYAGYNNGGSRGVGAYVAGYGGGGTHIATALQGQGETCDYVNHRDQLLIVAAGSGCSGSRSLKSGAGGGKDGVEGKMPFAFNAAKSKPGTQNGPGSNSPLEGAQHFYPQFGIGGCIISNGGKGVQGGGGYFGGGGSASTYSGSGGSSYIGNPQLKEGDTMNGDAIDHPGSLSTHPLYGTREVGACRIVWTCHRPAKRK